MVNDLPNKLEICDVDVVFTAQIEGVLSHNASLSKQGLRHLILCNERKNSGFLLWISSYFLSCIFQHQAQKGAKIDQKVMAFKIWISPQILLSYTPQILICNLSIVFIGRSRSINKY